MWFKIVLACPTQVLRTNLPVRRLTLSDMRSACLHADGSGGAGVVHEGEGLPLSVRFQVLHVPQRSK